MSKLYTAKDLEQMIKQGQSLDHVPADAKLTPMARDLMRKHRRSAPAKAAAPAAPTAAAASKHVMIHNPVLPNAPERLRARGERQRPRERVRGKRHVRPGGRASVRAHRERYRDRGRLLGVRDVRAQGRRGRRVGDAGQRQRLLREEVDAEIERGSRACRAYRAIRAYTRRGRRARVVATRERETERESAFSETSLRNDDVRSK